MKAPKISILCLAYNQKDFIKQCLDGFLSQKTDFEYEILVHDDASTDGTAEIIQEYGAKHPGILKPIYQTANQYSRGVKITPTIQLPRVKGQYIALCEGDDYWTDPKKLQIQVDFLDSHPNYSICFHPVKVIYENKEQPDSIYPEGKSGFTIEKLLQHNFIQTNSVVYRKQSYKDIATNITPGDWYLHLYHAQFGKIGFIDKVMAVYRRHPGGIWWNSDKELSLIWERHGIAHAALYKELDKIYGNNIRYKKIIMLGLVNIIDNLLDYDLSKKKDIIFELQAMYPDLLDQYVHSKRKEFLATRESLEQTKEDLKIKNSELEAKANELKLQTQLLDQIRHSKSWRLRNAVARFIGREVI